MIVMTSGISPWTFRAATPQSFSNSFPFSRQTHSVKYAPGLSIAVYPAPTAIISYMPCLSTQSPNLPTTEINYKDIFRLPGPTILSSIGSFTQATVRQFFRTSDVNNLPLPANRCSFECGIFLPIRAHRIISGLCPKIPKLVFKELGRDNTLRQRMIGIFLRSKDLPGILAAVVPQFHIIHIFHIRQSAIVRIFRCKSTYILKRKKAHR